MSCFFFFLGGSSLVCVTSIICGLLFWSRLFRFVLSVVCLLRSSPVLWFSTLIDFCLKTHPLYIPFRLRFFPQTLKPFVEFISFHNPEPFLRSVYLSTLLDTALLDPSLYILWFSMGSLYLPTTPTPPLLNSCLSITLSHLC